MTRLTLFIFVFVSALTVRALANRPVWPPPPDEPRLEYIGEMRCDELSINSGFFDKVKRFIGGRDEAEQLSLPFDVAVVNDRLFVTCQNIPYLIEIDRNEMDFRMHASDERPLHYPIAVCDGGDGRVFMTDSESKVVYLFSDGQLRPFITDHLVRPTGIAALPAQSRLYVVDTGDHSLKVFDLSGELVKTVPGGDSTVSLHFPTFARATADAHVLVNDALNYEIKRFDAEGRLLAQFGEEGDGVGTFSRPKGIAVDSDSHVYVVDNLFDNVQVFDSEGRILLVIGSRGQAAGQFWSPAGIDIAGDTVYIADTFNNRIQILHYMGGEQ